VLPVGGIKEKVLAAHRAGIKTVILPEENTKDLEEVPNNIKDNLCFVFVRTMDEVIDRALKPAQEVNMTHVEKSEDKGMNIYPS
jgi:ATP-dependent Lon protease